MSSGRQCAICGDLVHSAPGPAWQPGKQAQQSERDMQAHLNTHSFFEVLRYEIRQDLELVPDDQRPTIVRDIYRSLLGVTLDNRFALDTADGQGVYTLDDALGDIDVYRLWHVANTCREPACAQH